MDERKQKKVIDQHFHSLGISGGRSSVVLLAVTRPVMFMPFSNVEGLIEFSGRVCYDSTDKLGKDEEWIGKRIRQGHESILEHVSASFLILCSRAVSHELVRHRISSFSQRSQRFVSESKVNFVFPESLDEEQRSLFSMAMDESWKYYKLLLEKGVSREDARYVLPNACVTQLVMTMNFRELRHFISMRSDRKAMPEMRDIASQIFELCYSIAPSIFLDIKVEKEDVQE